MMISGAEATRKKQLYLPETASGWGGLVEETGSVSIIVNTKRKQRSRIDMSF